MQNEEKKTAVIGVLVGGNSNTSTMVNILHEMKIDTYMISSSNDELYKLHKYELFVRVEKIDYDQELSSGDKLRDIFNYLKGLNKNTAVLLHKYTDSELANTDWAPPVAVIGKYNKATISDMYDSILDDARCTYTKNHYVAYDDRNIKPIFADLFELLTK